jgi:hypothetical protein
LPTPGSTSSLPGHRRHRPRHDRALASTPRRALHLDPQTSRPRQPLTTAPTNKEHCNEMVFPKAFRRRPRSARWLRPRSRQPAPTPGLERQRPHPAGQSGPPVIGGTRFCFIMNTPGAQPRISATRNFAILHAAIYDAINRDRPDAWPYLICVRRAQPRVAAADAAALALVGLYPRSRASSTRTTRPSLRKCRTAKPRTRASVSARRSRASCSRSARTTARTCLHHRLSPARIPATTGPRRRTSPHRSSRSGARSRRSSSTAATSSARHRRPR